MIHMEFLSSGNSVENQKAQKCFKTFFTSKMNSAYPSLLNSCSVLYQELFAFETVPSRIELLNINAHANDFLISLEFRTHENKYLISGRVRKTLFWRLKCKSFSNEYL